MNCQVKLINQTDGIGKLTLTVDLVCVCVCRDICARFDKNNGANLKETIIIMMLTKFLFFLQCIEMDTDTVEKRHCFFVLHFLLF